ncbi:MTH1187 family thiamine-binding protein [Thiovibrio frasassiensis]|uniref:MTH1187 family thiamine-binding protein n=1 Tax=Thiovibrio frasassiensis TaxID=2984131 RepID=A0A9X4MGH7_9BACT|nr:MTH1187 family thiamine-binding protein [Thiovibrio frasassiensis]MDG4475815.1 MTH1187 family thiamine-binding protein [Thiovibrio frasassiensis]
MAIMQLTIIPLGTQTPSVGQYVADIQEILRREGVRHELTDMGTIIEGEVEVLLALASRLHGLPFGRGAQRVVTQIMLDERRDKDVKLGDKTAAVQARLT